jgi:hypothetical protein
MRGDTLRRAEFLFGMKLAIGGKSDTFEIVMFLRECTVDSDSAMPAVYLAMMIIFSPRYISDFY